MGDMMKRIAEDREERNRWIKKNCQDLRNLPLSERKSIEELRWKEKEEEEDRQRRRESAERANQMVRKELETERRKHIDLEIENRLLREILVELLQK